MNRNSGDFLATNIVLLNFFRFKVEKKKIENRSINEISKMCVENLDKFGNEYKNSEELIERYCADSPVFDKISLGLACEGNIRTGVVRGCRPILSRLRGVDSSFKGLDDPHPLLSHRVQPVFRLVSLSRSLSRSHSSWRSLWTIM